MNAFTQLRGRVAALDRADVDTDQIIPKQFLKRIERTGFEDYLFYDWRYQENGAPLSSFELNRPEAKGATILIAGRNFGCTELLSKMTKLCVDGSTHSEVPVNPV